MGKKKKKETKPLENARAPYSFVPFCPKLIQRYSTVEQLPPHDIWDKDLLTGEIQVTITAETPIFISNGAARDDIKGWKDLDFYRAVDNRYAIPGSSLRGLIRTNMQILGMGLIRPNVDFDDDTYFYRDFTSASASLGGRVKATYDTILGVETVKNKTIATAVQGGYLHCENGKYTIVPVQGKVLTITRESNIAEKWRERWAFTEEIWYQTVDTEVTALSADKPQEDDWLHGTLLGTGWMKKVKNLYIFPDEDTSKEAKIVELTQNEINIYKDDWKMRKNSLSGTRKEKQDSEFWALPEEGYAKPVFYISNGMTTSFGMCQYLRVAYGHSLSYYLPEAHKQIKGLFLDYPNAILGFSENKISYRSRVSVDDIVAVGEPKTMPLVEMILGEPKPSFYPNYMIDGKNFNDDYQNDQERVRGYLRGFKQYWMKPEEKTTVPADKKKVASAIKALPEGTKFTGTIRYKNLHEDELGLLLWCLQLNNSCSQNIGKAKPYGYGRISIHIDAMDEYNPTEIYSSLQLPDIQQSEQQTVERIEELIRIYDKEACDRVDLKPQNKGKKQTRTIKNMGHIKDFMYLKQTVRMDINTIAYMEPEDHKNIGKALPTVNELRIAEKEEEKTKKQQAKKKQNRETSVGNGWNTSLQAILNKMD